jgi:hypothetical protein
MNQCNGENFMKIFLTKSVYSVFSNRQRAIPDLEKSALITLLLAGSILLFLLTSCQTNSIVTITPTQNTPMTSPTLTGLPISISTPKPNIPSTTPTLLPTVDFNLAYTASTPLQDTQQMFSILKSLQQLEFSGLTEPGWYLRYDLMEPKLFPDDDKNNFLVHVVDQKGSCQEQMVFFRKNGKISPFIFMSADGSRGSVDQTTGEVYRMNDKYIPLVNCNIQNPGSLGGMSTEYYIQSDFVNFYENELNMIALGRMGDGNYDAWFEKRDEQEVFIVDFQSNTPNNGSYLDPETKENLTVESMNRQEVFDLASGRPLTSTTELILSNEKTVNWGFQYILEYYPELPADLQTAFDQAVAGLEALKK